jgi:heme exporter protein C
MKKYWWKILTVALLVFTVVAGLLMEVPRLAILNETIRNLFFHVPMWFGMIAILLVSMIYSIKYLRNPSLRNDTIAVEAAKVGVVFGVLGILTGMQWARFTWGEFWSSDPKQNASAIGLLIYGAYLVLRSSFAEQQQRARVSAVYNIFAFAALIPLLFILPRLTDSLHPGSGGNPGFNAYDLDARLRVIFYPAVLGWTLLGIWIVEVKSRFEIVRHRLEERFYENA